MWDTTQMYQTEYGKLNSRINGFERDIIYGIKCLFKKNPIKLLMIIFIINLFVFAIGIRITEYQSSL